jgi:hypothetical protein
MEDGYYPGMKCHVHCINSEVGRQWQRNKFRADAAYERYWLLQSIAYPIDCPNCGQQHNLSAKARGMGAGNWELCCTLCGKTNDNLLTYYRHPNLIKPLHELEEYFLRGQWGETQESQIYALEQEFAVSGSKNRCDCGGKFSLLGKPRCHKCKAVLMESYFHYSFIPAPGYWS